MHEYLHEQNIQDRGIMVFTKKTLSSQNSSNARFSLYNHLLFATQIKYSHDAEKIQTRFNKYLPGLDSS